MASLEAFSAIVVMLSLAFILNSIPGGARSRSSLKECCARTRFGGSHGGRTPRPSPPFGAGSNVRHPRPSEHVVHIHLYVEAPDPVDACPIGGDGVRTLTPTPNARDADEGDDRWKDWSGN